MIAAVEISGVTASYAGAPGPAKDAVLRDATLSVATGELVAILGPNGAGKTTLVRVAAGVLAPTVGTVRLFGDDVRSLDRRTIAQRVAVVAQTESVAFGFPVRDVVMMGRAPHQGGWMRASDQDRAVVAAAMERCDVAHLAARAYDELSGGEQRRVAIARGFAQEARVLVLDEPGAFLDVRHQIDLYERVRAEVAARDIACIVVMHDLNAAAAYASRVVLLKAGQIVAVGSVEEVMTYARLKETFDAELYVGVNELTGDRFFLPMRGKR